MCLESKHFIAIPPGDFMKERMEIDSISLEDFARHMSMSVEDARQLLDGQTPVTYPVACALVGIVGWSQSFWLRLQKQYGIDSAIVEAENNGDEAKVKELKPLYSLS